MARTPSSPDGAKNVTISIRMTPKMRFGLELMSRLHNRTLPEVVGYAITEVFTSEIEGLYDNRGPEEVGGKRYLLNLLWADRASDRLANLAFQCPELLTIPETRMWSRITQIEQLWSGDARDETHLNRDALAERWQSLEQEFSLGARGTGSTKG